MSTEPLDMISAPFVEGLFDGQVGLKSVKSDPSRKMRLVGWEQCIVSIGVQPEVEIGLRCEAA